jgi:hypothetical protein
VHLVSYDTAGPPQYRYKPAGGAMTGAQLLEGGVVTARMLETAAMAFLVMGFADGHVGYKAVPLAQASQAIDWSAIPEGAIDVPPNAGAITLLPESAMYQTTATEVAFAFDGYTEQGTIWFVSCQ